MFISPVANPHPVPYRCNIPCKYIQFHSSVWLFIAEHHPIQQSFIRALSVLQRDDLEGIRATSPPDPYGWKTVWSWSRPRVAVCVRTVHRVDLKRGSESSRAVAVRGLRAGPGQGVAVWVGDGKGTGDWTKVCPPSCSQERALSVQVRVFGGGRGGGSRHWLLVHSELRDEGSG